MHPEDFWGIENFVVNFLELKNAGKDFWESFTKGTRHNFFFGEVWYDLLRETMAKPSLAETQPLSGERTLHGNPK